MRKGLFLFVIVAITSGVLSSCIYNIYEEVVDKTPSTPAIETGVKFSSRIFKSNYSSTRLIGDKWDSGDTIGVYMFEKDNYTIADGGRNVKYITERGGYTGDFIAKSDIIYFPEDEREVRFMSYYPYNESVKNFIYKINVSNQISQSNLDLFYSFDRQITYCKNLQIGSVPMSFDNQMAKVVIHVRNGESLQGYDLMNMKVYFSGLSTNADFDLISGEINNYSAVLPIYPHRLIAKNGNVYTGEAVMIPTSGISNAMIVIDLNNGNEHKESDVFTWNLNKILEKSKLYTYHVTVNNSGIKVNSTVHNWHVILQETDV